MNTILPQNTPLTNCEACDTALYVDHRGQRVLSGIVREKTFFRMTKNMLNKPPALCLNSETVARLREMGVTTIEIFYAGETTYTCSLETGLLRGYESEQVCLPLAYWAVERVTSDDEPALVPAPQMAKGQQLKLFSTLPGAPGAEL